jgi:hypothetical protein
MADGSTVAIDRVEVGNLVATRDPNTGETSAQPILAVIEGYGDKHLIGITTEPAATGADEANVSKPEADTWTATANHPIWVKDHGWTDAAKIHVGDVLPGMATDQRVVSNVHDYGWVHNQTVYNLSIANVHTYIVGASGGGTLVHNCSSSNAARRAAMRDAGIPTSARPVRTISSPHGRAYEYMIDGRRMAVVHGRTDRSHVGAPHWEAGPVKIRDGGVARDSIGRPRLINGQKSKRYY